MTVRRRRDLVIAITIAVCGLVYYLSYFNFDINPSDEGYLCYGTHRVLEGQVPGADFHAYEPGRYWVLAPFFAAFGEDVVVERAVFVVVRVVIAVLAYCAARILLPVSLALVATVPTIVVPGPWHKSWFSLLMLVSYLLVQGHVRQPRPWLPWVGGIGAGIALVFRLDIGVFSALLWASAMVCGPRSRGGVRALAGQLARFSAGVFGPVVAAGAVLTVQGGLKPAVTFFVSEYLNASGSLERIHPKIAGFPSLLASVRKAPTDLFELMIWMSLGSAALLAMVIAARWRREHSPPCALLLLWLTWLCACAGVVLQPDRSHLLQNGPLLWIVIVSSLFLVETQVSTRPAPGRPRVRVPWPSTLLATVVVAALIAENLFGAGIDSYYTGSIRMRFGPHEPSALPHASLEIDPWRAEEYRGLVEYITDHSAPGDGIATCFCLPLFNLMSERENPTGLDILFPHTIGREDQQRRFLDNLAGVRLLLVNTCEFSRDRPQRCPPSDHTLEDFAPAVVDHIKNQWQPVYTSIHGFATIYARRSSFQNGTLRYGGTSDNPDHRDQQRPWKVPL